MEKEFVPYAEALALKELGFNKDRNFKIHCFYGYQSDSYTLNKNNGKPEFYFFGEGTNNWQEVSYTCEAPLYQQAFRWFREKHGINSTIDNDLYEDDNHIVYSYNLSRLSTADDLIELDEDDFVDTYEEAELECLKKLIEIVKEK